MLKLKFAKSRFTLRWHCCCWLLAELSWLKSTWNHSPAGDGDGGDEEDDDHRQRNNYDDGTDQEWYICPTGTRDWVKLQVHSWWVHTRSSRIHCMRRWWHGDRRITGGYMGMRIWEETNGCIHGCKHGAGPIPKFSEIVLDGPRYIGRI